MKTIRFTPIDSCFFKEARPMDGFGGSELSSLFPPPVRTLAGAIRTAYGDTKNVNWQEFGKAQTYADIKDKIGDANGYGKLKFGGVFVEKGGKRLYPAPKNLLKRDDEFAFMHIGNAVECDIGIVRLPQLPHTPNGEKRFSPLPDRAWLDSDNFAKVLGGQLPSNIYTEDMLFGEESRVGIGINNKTKTVNEGQLYQTKHIRLKEDVTIALDVDNLPDDFIKNGFCRFGGEGRAAAFAVQDVASLPKARKPKDVQILGVVIVLVTPALITPNWFSATLKGAGTEDKFLETVNGVELAMVSACIGKSVREGGFDIANNRSKEAKSYLPPGSMWFCEVQSNISMDEAVEMLHGIKIGDETELGYGLVACGYWTNKKGGQ